MRYLFTSLLFLTINLIFGQAKYTKILKSIQENKSVYTTVAHQIWSYAEMGYQEEQSSALLQKISESLGLVLGTKFTEGVEPYSDKGKAGGSTDVGDVSFVVPTVGLRAATWVPGTPAHSWQAVVAGGTDIGNKGMMIAAKTLALTGMQLLDSPKTIKAAKEEFIKKRGVDFIYTPMLGDRKSALNYRN